MLICSKVPERSSMSVGEKLLRVIPENLCYLFFVAHESHFSFFQYHLSSHEFFRLLSYTASYF
jgi:hypothetical protein